MEAEVQMSDSPKSAGQEKQAKGPNMDGDSMHKSSLIKDGLEKNISEESKNKIYGLLNEISKLTDVEKLLLYLKLPTGIPGNSSTTSLEGPGYQRDEHQKALRWLRTHLEEDTGTCVQKEELYTQYREFCGTHEYKCVNQFDFGKLLRHLFPNLKLRHLGQRGQSKTCYGGLKNCGQLKPLEVPSLDISEDLNQRTHETCGEEDSITQAAGELVCEWAQKLHGNKQFSGVQALSEHLITNCVVSTNSTAAFTIIAAAQKEDRNIFTDTQAAPSKYTGVEGSSTKPLLQAKTHLQLQRTLKGRQMLKEQRERMEDRTTDPKTRKACDPDTASGTSANEGKMFADTSKSVESKPSATVKRLANIMPQKHILPKSAIGPVLGQSSKSVVIGGQRTLRGLSLPTPQVLTPSVTATSIPGSKALPQPIFVLPSHVMSPAAQGNVPQNTSVIKTAPMLLLSPVNSKGVMTLNKQKVSAHGTSQPQRSQNKDSSSVKASQAWPGQGKLRTVSASQSWTAPTAAQAKPSQTKGTVTQVTSSGGQTTGVLSKPKVSSKLAMLLTENQTDSCERRLLERALKHKDAQRISNSQRQAQRTETILPLKHLPGSELKRAQSNDVDCRPVTLLRSASQDSPRCAVTRTEGIAQRQSRAMSIDNPQSSGSPIINLSGDPMVLLGKTPCNVVVPAENGARASTIEVSSQMTIVPAASALSVATKPGNCKGKKKQVKINTPVKPRQSSKTVSTLLKETRGYGPQTDVKGFVNDRRPVAQLLKECRNRKLSTDSPTPSPLVVRTVVTPTLNAPQPGVNEPNTERRQPIGVSNESTVESSTNQLLFNQSANTSHRRQSLEMTQSFTNYNPSISSACISTVTSGYTAVSATSVSHSGSTELPSHHAPAGRAQQDFQQTAIEARELALHRLPLSGKDPFTCFGKEPVIPGSELMMSESGQNCVVYPGESTTFSDQDNNNNQEYDVKAESIYNSDDSNELQIHLGSIVDSVNAGFDHGDGFIQSSSSNSLSAMTVHNPETSRNEVSISNLEEDALSDYMTADLASDLADITPSLTMEGNSSGQNLQDREPFPVSGHSLPGIMPVDGNLVRRALVAENRNPFMSMPDNQPKLSFVANLQLSNDNCVTRGNGQRPASELLQYNQEVGSMPQDISGNRPSTMPPELDVSFQNYLMQTQPTLSINDQNSCDSVSGYNSVGQVSTSSQMLRTRSPSFGSMGSAPSTPSSLMSPPERFHPNKTNSEPTNSFMPIQGSSGAVPLDQVSPIRPMVTLARRMANGMMGNYTQQNGHLNMKMTANQMNKFPRFTNPSSNSTKTNYESSFVPYSTSDNQGPVLAQQQHEMPQSNIRQPQQAQPQTVNSFLPASSIRPVKRPLTGAQNGSRKRVRHRSAQDAQSLAKSQAKQSNDMLTRLLKSGCATSLSLQNVNLSNIVSNQRPNNLPKPLVVDQTGCNLSNPQSPFSPEMQDIMTGEQPKIVESQENADFNAAIFRSHSVPAQTFQRAGSETQDVASASFSWDQSRNLADCLKENQPQPDLSHLQGKAQDPVPSQRGVNTAQYSEYSARRNINNLLQEEQTTRNNWGYTDTCNPQYRTVRGDHMISGASVRTSHQLALLNNPAVQMAIAQRIQRAVSFPGDGGVPTPPSSQNPTPDFSTELSAIADPAANFCIGRATASTVMDTPNSLDPLTTGDSQESLKEDQLLTDIYKGNPVIAMTSGVVAGHGWTGREVCPQWNHSQ